MGRVIGKFGLYTQHLQHSIDTAKNSQDREDRKVYEIN